MDPHSSVVAEASAHTIEEVRLGLMRAIPRGKALDVLAGIPSENKIK